MGKRSFICRECGEEFTPAIGMSGSDLCALLFGLFVAAVGWRVLDKLPIYPAFAINWGAIVAAGILGLGVYSIWRAVTPSGRCTHCGSNHYADLATPLGEELSKEWAERRSGNEDSD
jgi:hypothetical protein